MFFCIVPLASKLGLPEVQVRLSMGIVLPPQVRSVVVSASSIQEMVPLTENERRIGFWSAAREAVVSGLRLGKLSVGELMLKDPMEA